MLTRFEILDALRLFADRLSAPVWLAGGAAADFHVGRFTRDHHDIDLVAFSDDRDTLTRDLRRLRFTQLDDRGWITHWTRDRLEVSLAFEERVDAVTGRIVVRAEHAGDSLVAGIYPQVPGNLDLQRYAEVDGVRFRVASAESDWLYAKGFRAFRPGSRHRPTVEHNLRLLEQVLTGADLARLRPLIGRREPLCPATGRIRLRPYADDRDLVAMQRLATRLWPLGFHPGGLAWSVTTNQFFTRSGVLAEDGDEIVGFAGIEEPGVLLAQADPSRLDAAGALVEWFRTHDESPRGFGVELRADVVETDESWRRALVDAGFARLGDERPVWQMRRAATTDVPPPPDGYVVRNVEPEEEEVRVAVHRAAWNPHALPWTDGHRPDYPSDAESRHSDAIYARVRDAWLYDSAFDLIAVAEDGSFAGSCIVWLDSVTGVAEIEPLGVVPEHRNRGVAGALCHEAVRRVAKADGRDVIINNGPNVAYPAPGGAYAKAGFGAVDRGRTYVLRR